MECQVCCETFNKSNHSKVSCYCNFVQCSTCAEKYLLETPNDPHCMNCKTGWNREKLLENFTKKFVGKTFKERRENILFERERALMPATQPAAERTKKMRDLMKQIQVKDGIAVELFNQQNQILNEPCADDEARLARYRRYLDVKARADESYRERMYLDYQNNILMNRPAASGPRREFIRACPANDCRGFLSTGWKCGMCDTKVCPTCHEIKTEDEHECKPENVETARLLAKDTRPCPNCASMIFKIDGCDQMYCTACNTAFSWRTGQVETGRVHNPHYYDYLRRVNNGNIPREPGDIVHNQCGMIPHANHINQVINLYPTSRHEIIFLLSLLQVYWHVDHIIIPRVRPGAPDTETLRINYMIGELTEEVFKKELQKIEKSRQKKNEIHDILTTYQNVTRDQLRLVIDNQRNLDVIRRICQELFTLRDYINEQMTIVSKRYTCVTPRITENWMVLNVKG